MTVVTDEQRVWRVSRVLRVYGYSTMVGAAIGGVSIVGVATDEGVWWQGVLFVGILFGGPMAIGYRYLHRSRVELHASHVRVVSMFSEHEIPWRDIVGAEPGYSGLAVRLRDGGVVLAGAVQKANFAVWTGRRTRSDVLAETIMERAAAARM